MSAELSVADAVALDDLPESHRELVRRVFAVRLRDAYLLGFEHGFEEADHSDLTVTLPDDGLADDVLHSEGITP